MFIIFGHKKRIFYKSREFWSSSVLVDQLTPGYYCTLPRNMARRHKPGPGDQSQASSRNSSQGSMNEVTTSYLETMFRMQNIEQSLSESAYSLTLSYILYLMISNTVLLWAAQVPPTCWNHKFVPKLIGNDVEQTLAEQHHWGSS